MKGATGMANEYLSVKRYEDKTVLLEGISNDVGCYVLATWKGQFITWFHNKQTGGFSLGHYFSDLQTALSDFNARNANQYIK